jgi:hypothetical protein
MSGSMNGFRAVPGMSQFVSIVMLLLTCGGLFAQNKDQEHRVRNLVWFTAPGQMVPAGRACTTFLSKMAIP